MIAASGGVGAITTILPGQSSPITINGSYSFTNTSPSISITLKDANGCTLPLIG